ncbi:MAG: hypothetical protein ACOH10_08020 [Rhodoglobus sp.]
MFPVSALFAQGRLQPRAQVVSSLGATSLGEVHISGGSISWAVGDKSVTSRLDLTVADPHGTVAVGTLTSPLGWFGQRLTVRAGVSRPSWRELIPMGVWRVASLQPAGSVRWVKYRNGVSTKRGTAVTVSTDDLLTILEEDPLDVLEQPQPGATVRSEAVRLTGARLPVASSWAGFVDATVGSAVTYDSDRLSALGALARLAGAVVGVGRSGELQFYTPGTTPVLKLTSNRVGSLVPKMTRTGLYSAFRVEGTDVSGASVIGRATVTSGRLATATFGVVTKRLSSPLMRTVPAATEAAYALMDNTLAQAVDLVEITTPSPLEVDPLDMVTIITPDGPLVGHVVAAKIPLGPEPASLTIAIPAVN